MNGIKKFSLMALCLVLLCASGGVSDALAQRGGGGLAGPLEFSATYGSMWGGNLGTRYGKLRTATGASYGLALDIPVHPSMAVELSYTRQDGALDYDTRTSLTKLTDMSINYWQIGAVRGLTSGKVRPFLTTGLGVTYYSPEESEVTIEGEDYQLSSSTKFSLVIGAGFKAYFGKSEKIGLRASIKTFPTLYNTSGGLWFGSGGASVGVSGDAIWQWEAAAGLTVKFGG